MSALPENINYVETYYKNHYPYLAKKFEYNHWYYDTDTLLYIHPNGFPIYYDLDPVMLPHTEEEFLITIEHFVNYAYNNDFSNHNPFLGSAIASFNTVKDDLVKMYKFKMDPSMKTATLGDLLAFVSLELEHIENKGAVNTKLSNIYGHYNEIDENVILIPSGVYIEADTRKVTIPKRLRSFFNTVEHVLMDKWVLREHIQLLFNAYDYLTKKDD